MYTNNDNVTIEHWPKNSFSLGSLPDLLAPLKVMDATSITESLFLNKSIDEASIATILDNMEQSKFVDKPHFLMTMDEKTAFELIVKGE